VLLYKSKLGHMSGKLRSTWEGPFIVTKIFPYGAVEIKEKSLDDGWDELDFSRIPFALRR